MCSVRAIFLNFRGTNDTGWLWYIDCNFGAAGVVFGYFCELSYVFGFVDNLVLYSVIWASKSILLKDVERKPKNPAKSMHATLACMFTCVCVEKVF